MKQNLKTYRLGEIAEVQTGPFGSQLHQKDYVLVGTPIITVEHLGENSIIHENLPLVSDEDKQRLKKYWLKEGDIVFSRVGSVDRRAYVKKDEDGWLFSGRCLRVRPKPNSVDAKYLSYYFGLEEFKRKIRGVAVGATMPSLNTSIMNDIEVTIADDLNTQHDVAAILSSLDDKIELNHQMSHSLEAIAQTLFREWFFNFNFPGFDGELVNGLPKEWRRGSVLEVANLLSGGTPRTDVKEYWYGDIKWISARDITEYNGGFIVDTEKKIAKEGLKNSAAKMLPVLTTVVSARGTVGNYCILPEEMTISQSNYGLKSKVPDNDFFVFLLVKSMIDMMQQYSYGTVFDTITTKIFKEIEVVLPDENVALEFNQIVKPLFEKILSNTTATQVLKDVRDSLLPKLMSGKIEIKK